MFAICGTSGKTMQEAFIIESFGEWPADISPHICTGWQDLLAGPLIYCTMDPMESVEETDK